MEHRLRILGAVLAVIGVIAVAGGAYGYTRVQGGANALQGFSAAQDVRLTYDEDGQLVDRGSVEGGAAILALLADEWGWPVNRGELDPADPVVDTGTEYMYQMATIAYHTLHGAQSVTLTEPAEWDGDGVEGIAADATVYSPATLPEGTWDPAVEGTDADAIFEPGTYVVPVNGRYWTAFDRTHPLDGKARELAWSGTVHGLFAELGVGATDGLEPGDGPGHRGHAGGLRGGLHHRGPGARLGRLAGTGQGRSSLRPQGADAGRARIASLSRSEVSRICAALDAEVEAFRDRPLTDEAYPYLWLDATYLKVREAGRVVSMAALVAVGVARSGERRILGLELAPGNDEGSAWPAFVRSLVERGLAGVRLVISDDHRGLVKAIREQLLGAAWQRCRVHLTRNAQDLVPRSGAEHGGLGHPDRSSSSLTSRGARDPGLLPPATTEVRLVRTSVLPCAGRMGGCRGRRLECRSGPENLLLRVRCDLSAPGRQIGRLLARA